MRAAAQKSAIFQGGDQAMNARFGPQIERFLHFLKGRGKTGLTQVLVNEHQQFVLLAR
jgi:hypothetical protein